MKLEASISWCLEDDCPASICGGPHWSVETTMSIEVVRYDQEPIGTPIERDGEGGDANVY